MSREVRWFVKRRREVDERARAKKELIGLAASAASTPGVTKKVELWVM